MRDKIIEDILIALRDGYNNKHNERTNNRGDNNLNGEAKEEAMGNGFGGEHLRSAARGVLLTIPQYSINTDMPFFAGIIFNTRDVWVESCCWSVYAHNDAGIIFNTRDVWVESCCWSVYAHNDAGIIFNTRDV